MRNHELIEPKEQCGQHNVHLILPYNLWRDFNRLLPRKGYACMVIRSMLVSFINASTGKDFKEDLMTIVKANKLMNKAERYSGKRCK